MQTWQKSCSVQFDREQSLLKPLDPLRLCAGWLRLRSAHLSSLRQVLPGGPAALLHGGPRHRRRHLLEGEPGAVIMHETVTRRQEFESRRRKKQRNKTAEQTLADLWSRRRYGMTGYFQLHLLVSSLQALSTDSIERLPVYNTTALKNYKVSQEADDWCIPSKEPLDLRNYKVAKWKCPPGLGADEPHIPRRLQHFCLPYSHVIVCQGRCGRRTFSLSLGGHLHTEADKSVLSYFSLALAVVCSCCFQYPVVFLYKKIEN